MAGTLLIQRKTQNNQSINYTIIFLYRDNILHAPRVYSWGKFWYLHAVIIIITVAIHSLIDQISIH